MKGEGGEGWLVGEEDKGAAEGSLGGADAGGEVAISVGEAPERALPALVVRMAVHEDTGCIL